MKRLIYSFVVNSWFYICQSLNIPIDFNDVPIVMRVVNWLVVLIVISGLCFTLLCVTDNTYYFNF
jgi:hypothetical protein